MFSPNAYVKAFIPSVMEFGGGVFGEICHEDGALMNGIYAFIRRQERAKANLSERAKLKISYFLISKHIIKLQ